MNSTRIVIRGFFGLFLLFAGIPALWAQNSFERGEELFMQNKPQEALRFLESAVSEDPAHVQAFIYLGIVYLQVNRLDDAIATYTRILPRSGAEAARIAFNLGNAYFIKGNTDLALQSYSQAIQANPAYASAYLNRANTLVKTGDLPKALENYDTYLYLNPGSAQREQVLRIQTFIKDELAAIERLRILAEEAARAEAERRRRLLQAVTESLQAVADDSLGLSAGTEKVQDFTNEFEMD